MAYRQKQNTGAYRPDPGESGDASGDKSDIRLRESRENDAIDVKYGFNRISGEVREDTGYLLNMHSTEILDEDKRLIAAVDYYFIQMDGARFKVSLPFKPYFYVLIKKVNFLNAQKHLTLLK
jgi:DNA polymerase epsilon subunit 1